MTVGAHRRHTATRYCAYGHVLSCNSPLPELERTLAPPFPEHTDLHIRFSSPEEHLPIPATWYRTVSLADGTPWLRSAKIASGYLLEFPDLAAFVFTPSDNSIQCIPHGHTPSHTLHHLLLDQVLPLALNHRGKEVLHGAAVATPYGTCAFIGPTGSGKSTLAASFLASGYSVLADDCVVLDARDDDLVAIPSYPGLRLWNDTVDALFGTAGRMTPVAHYTPKQRFHATVSASTFPSSSVPLTGMYLLESFSGRHAASVTTPLARPLLGKRDALITLLSSALKLDIADQRMLTREFDFLHRLVSRIPVRRLVIPKSFEALPEVRAGILQDLSNSC
ncbi:MAG: hypothetical protein OEU68_05130 [Nitrospira sp.]|jgi:hypothetical protein|nr:hypothetical protein [Nitrospira sp.]MDH4245022.1 hypothetical protein [Nitrospira sp.]MDH4357336.1 hypothetical protein [Nitrospira sp.]MDH5319570.1 hypothetical protein [Nitrospira sp.]